LVFACSDNMLDTMLNEFFTRWLSSLNSNFWRSKASFKLLS